MRRRKRRRRGRRARRRGRMGEEDEEKEGELHEEEARIMIARNQTRSSNRRMKKITSARVQGSTGPLVLLRGGRRA